jgi:hypothetical protein
MNSGRLSIDISHLANEIESAPSLEAVPSLDDSDSHFYQRQRPKRGDIAAFASCLDGSQERSEQVAKWVDLVEQKAKGAQLAHPVAGGQQPHESGVINNLQMASRVARLIHRCATTRGARI